ncbi:transmembrane emp24 domain-containing protein 10-like [Sycon ciliatum]|uniref:transmembrane emp24 domain-containing protein 10-like n=1 Tax=Sycon ciliatum TaxID=27933 RepID=UPI0020AD29FC|eukprot:scpid61264/ scgid33596/ Transmembrane emp24 domain-containing protein 10; 21 kDa transmembrane-trafficking protein; Transmembrane protein Tmp21; p24 family protein delta-1
MASLWLAKSGGIVAVLLSLSVCANGLSFYLTPGEKRCLKEEVHKQQMVVGQYSISDGEPAVSILATDQAGHTLFSKENAKQGKFAFTEDEFEVVDICFKSHTNAVASHIKTSREVKLTLKHGAEARNYDQIAKAEKLKPLELELRRLEDLAQEVVNDFQYMREREKEMRDTNESTNSRVFWFSIFSIGCLVTLATWQVFYLRDYFKKQKLI